MTYQQFFGTEILERQSVNKSALQPCISSALESVKPAQGISY